MYACCILKQIKLLHLGKKSKFIDKTLPFPNTIRNFFKIFRQKPLSTELFVLSPQEASNVSANCPVLPMFAYVCISMTT